MPPSAVTTVKIDSMASQQPSHNGGNRGEAGFQKQMEMIGKKRPGITGSLAFAKNIAQTLNKILTIGIIFEYIALFDTANNNMM